ncbi:hypothetical protein EON65_47525 [archaeon]|nr:MAG: hypothetical protein EON65_47525 [archaeon]
MLQIWDFGNLDFLAYAARSRPGMRLAVVLLDIAIALANKSYGFVSASKLTFRASETKLYSYSFLHDKNQDTYL